MTPFKCSTAIFQPSVEVLRAQGGDAINSCSAMIIVRMWLRYFFITSALVALSCMGCKKPRTFIGTWQTTTATQGGADSKMTFNPDHTMSFTAKNGPTQMPYTLTGFGTWSSTEKDLTVTPASMTLDGLNPVAKARMEPYLQASVSKPQTGVVIWKSDDEFICRKAGVDQDFKRVP